MINYEEGTTEQHLESHFVVLSLPVGYLVVTFFQALLACQGAFCLDRRSTIWRYRSIELLNS